MAERFDLVLRGGQVVTPWGVLEADIGVRGEKITHIGPLPQGVGGEEVSLSGLHVLPGVMDTQVHFREPGFPEKEDLASGSRAAVLGGVTCVFEMPNTSPPTTTRAAIVDKLARARGRMFCDHAFYVGATPANLSELAELESLPGVAGVKAFLGSSTGDLLLDDPEDLARLLRNIRRRAAFHAEDEARLLARKDLRERGNPASHALWRDETSALSATQRLVTLAEAAGKPVHVLHVTTAEEMAFLAEHRDLVSVEVTPQHLTLAAPEAYETLGTRAQMNPPIRDSRHRDALWAAVAQGLVDVVASDHAPHTLAEKAAAYPDSPSGMPGVQTLVPIMLDHVAAGRLSLLRLADLTAHGPQRLFQIAGKGRSALGYDADFTIVDLKARRRLEDDQMASRCGWTPFAGRQVTGWPVGTIIRGRRVMWAGEILGEAAGAPVRFLPIMPHVSQT